MAGTIAYRFTGPTALLSVAASSHAAVTISQNVSDVTNYAAFLNTGANPVGVLLSATTAGTAVLPTDGNSVNTTTFVLPGSMTQPLVVAVPSNSGAAGSFSVSAIGTAAGPASVWITPCTFTS